MDVGIIESFFVIFTSATVLAAVALYTRQPLIVAYIAVGCAFGPHGLALVPDAAMLAEIGEIGIIFLLFLVGLDLPPSKLKDMFGESVLTAIASCLVFAGIGFAVMALFGFTMLEAAVTAIACMFSSTILGIKLLPTTVLHHRHTGEIVISLLLIQDLIAVIALLVLAGMQTDSGGMMTTALTVAVALPVVVTVAFAGVRFAVVPLLTRFDVFREFTFLLAIGWCLGIASLSHALYLSWEIGAFLAGVSLANSPIAQYITENLRPLLPGAVLLLRGRRHRSHAAAQGVDAHPHAGAGAGGRQAAGVPHPAALAEGTGQRGPRGRVPAGPGERVLAAAGVRGGERDPLRRSRACGAGRDGAHAAAFHVPRDLPLP